MSSMKPYLDRNKLLLELGFSSYNDYLRSSLWRSIRYKRLKKKCAICLNPASDLHHLSYSKEVLLGLDGTKFVSLCSGCHRTIEFDEGGHKRSLSEANQLLTRLRNPFYRRRYFIRRKYHRKKS